MTDEDVEAELRSQLMDAFGGADFPVSNQMDLVPALPNGPGTKFEAGDTSFTAMEMAAKLGSHQEFPYEDAESLVDDVIEGLKAEGMI
ncbi:MTH865 family protein [Halobaculum sp. D14]|uniref:MTH865 family protein n=1 Tax=unclassified Halobaculum TaxID=2640896 RepID=UPI003EBCD438